MIEFANASFSYGKTPIFSSLNITVQGGEILGICGPNGCGKSTLLNYILNQRTDGTAYVPQDFQRTFVPFLSLDSNIRIFVKSSSHFCARDIRHSLELDVDLSKIARESSGGMLQQAAIIRALTSGCSVLIADEPFSALDQAAITRLKPRLRLMIKEHRFAAVFVLHSFEDLTGLCDRIMVIPSRPFTGSAGHPGSVVRFALPPQVSSPALPLTYSEMASRAFNEYEREE